MAVFTHLSERALKQHLRPFQVGELIEARGMSAGGITTIYDVSTTRGRFILRILEGKSKKDAEYEESLLLHLAAKGLTVPRMVDAGKRGHVIAIAKRQQLSVFQYLPGRQLGVFEVAPQHTRQVGEFLATMHLAGRGFRRRRVNRSSPGRLARVLERCAYAAADTGQLRDLRSLAIELVRHHFVNELPRGTIHGELFLENVRFVRGNLSGVLDFETASSGPFAYDLAIALCDWAFLHDELVIDRARALVAGYQGKRPLCAVERGQLFELCRLATTRFAISRFYEYEVRAKVGRESRRPYRDYHHFLRRLQSLRELGPQRFRDLVLGRLDQARRSPDSTARR